MIATSELGIKRGMRNRRTGRKCISSSRGVNQVKLSISEILLAYGEYLGFSEIEKK